MKETVLHEWEEEDIRVWKESRDYLHVVMEHLRKEHVCIFLVPERMAGEDIVRHLLTPYVCFRGSDTSHYDGEKFVFFDLCHWIDGEEFRLKHIPRCPRTGIFVTDEGQIDSPLYIKLEK